MKGIIKLHRIYTHDFKNKDPPVIVRRINQIDFELRNRKKARTAKKQGLELRLWRNKS
mgnify:CR=1 FL=1